MGRRRKDAAREEKPARTPRAPRKDISVTAKTPGQQELIDAILDENVDVILCNGQAGTGKTLVAVGCALKLLRDQPNKYNRIVMVRPAVVVKGEEMGYLPGDANDKIAPFIAPMIDSLGHFLDQGAIQSLRASGAVEAIPVAFLRGRTLNNCVVIFDEAQNSRWEHMKMFLTRIGFNCKVIVEGDINQSDLEGPVAANNGLKVAMDKLEDMDGIELLDLTIEDVVRSPIVKRILSRI